MKILKLVFIFLIAFLFSCKKTEVSGIVYSKNNIPVPGVDVKVYYTIGSIDNPEGKIATTDGSGHYYMSFRSKYKFGKAYTVKCESDSGKARGIVKLKKSNLIDLHFR